jgi:hypothetical protein
MTSKVQVVALAIAFLSCSCGSSEARDPTGPKSPTLQFQMLKQWLVDGMRLSVGDVYPGKKYPRNVALDVAGRMVVVPFDYVAVIEQAGFAPRSIAELEQEQRELKHSQREAQAKNPEFHAYTTGKMSEADRRKLEQRAREAMMSVEDYTSLSGLERHKARQAALEKTRGSTTAGGE